MNTDDMDKYEHAYLEQWLETTSHYLFANRERLADAASSSIAASSLPTTGQCHHNDESMRERDAVMTEKTLLQLRLDSRGSQIRFISRVRGRLLRLVKRTAQCDQNPLCELECTFYSQVLFIARNPDVPVRMLGWLLGSGNDRIRRRVRSIIGHHEAKLSRLIDRAKRQGLVRAGVDPRAAAERFVAMIQGLALRRCVDPHQPERFLKEAAKIFPVYLNDIRTQAQA